MKRNEAIEHGLFKYQSDQPCRRGHEPWRYTNTGACVGCVAYYGRLSRSTQDNVMLVETVHADDVDEIREFIKSLSSDRSNRGID